MLRENTDFKEADINNFYIIASTVGNLLLAEEGYTIDIHFHERLHRIIDESLNENEKASLIEARRDFLLFMDEPSGERSNYGEIFNHQNYVSSFLYPTMAMGSWSELYAYMGQLEKFPVNKEGYTINKEFYKEFEKQQPNAFNIYKRAVDEAFAICGFYAQESSRIIFFEGMGRVTFYKGTEFIKDEVEGMGIYQKLQDMPYEIIIETDNDIYDRGNTGEAINEAEPSENIPEIKVKIVSEDFLPNMDEIDRNYFYPTVYHELVHANQMQILDDYSKCNFLNTPQWKIQFYIAALEDNAYNIGSELDAAYNEITYTESIGMPISRAQIAFYLNFLSKIKRTEAYNSYPEIKTLVKSYDEQVWEIAQDTYKQILNEYGMSYPLIEES